MKTSKDTIALIVAMFSLAISGFSLYQTSHHDKISLKPLLNFVEEPDDSDPQVGLLLENEGLGPAIIKSVDIFIDRKPVKDWEQAVNYCKIKNSDAVAWTTIEKNEAIKEGKTIALFYRRTKNKNGLNSFLDCLDEHLEVLISYCSFDDECWKKCFNLDHCN